MSDQAFREAFKYKEFKQRLDVELLHELGDKYVELQDFVEEWKVKALKCYREITEDEPD